MICGLRYNFFPWGLAAPDHAVPYGTVLSRDAFPGTSCQATIGVVPTGRACRHFALARSFATVAKARLDLMLILDRARHVTDKPNIGRQIGQADIFVPHLEQVEMAPDSPGTAVHSRPSAATSASHSAWISCSKSQAV